MLVLKYIMYKQKSNLFPHKQTRISMTCRCDCKRQLKTNQSNVLFNT